MANWNSQYEREYLAHRCREDFYSFCIAAYGLAFNPRHAEWFCPRIHKPICDWYGAQIKDWLAHRRSGVQKRLAVIVPRSFGKTTLITQAGQLWLHLQDPELSTYTGSEALARAEEFLGSIARVMDGTDPYAKFAWLYGNWYDKTREWRRDRIVHAARHGVARKEPSFGCWGVEKTITGLHPDAGFLDDPTSYEAMAAHLGWLQIVNNHTDALLPIFSGGALMVWPGTRYADGDHLGRAMRIDGVRSMAGMPLPNVDVRPDGLWDVYFLAARDADGKAVYNEKWNDAALRDFERKNNLRYWAQMMNDPAQSIYNPLSREKLRAAIIPQKLLPRGLQVSFHLDTAFKSIETQARGDESVIIKMGHQLGTGRVYFLEGVGSNLWNMEEFIERLVAMLKRSYANGEYIRGVTDEWEPGGKVGTWEYALRSACHGAGIRMPPFFLLSRFGKKKLMRLVEGAGFIQDDLAFFVDSAPGLDRLIEQLAKIGQTAADDWCDAAMDVFSPKIYQPRNPLGIPDAQPEVPRFAGDDYLKQVMSQSMDAVYGSMVERRDELEPI